MSREGGRSRTDFGEVRLDSSSQLGPHGKRQRRSGPPNDLPNDRASAAGVRGGAGSSLSPGARVWNQRLACTSAIVRRVDGSTSSIPSRRAVRAGESWSSRRYKQRMASTDERRSSCARLSASKRGSLSLASSTGKMPSTRAKRHTPSDQTSACLPSYLCSRLAEITSGAAYELVPQTQEHVRERGARPRSRQPGGAAAEGSKCATSKSMILTCEPPASVRSMLSSLRSRCATPRECMWTTPAITPARSSLARSSGTRPLASSSSSPPPTASVTRISYPFAVLHVSRSITMLGWRPTRASAATSSGSLSSPALRGTILIATSLPSRREIA
mmetsp:Transcript_2509/g.8237  ORF Transcript_2509/g.8237 Transcript_2509/m.8237 type:complete len:330 (+) Transcript_2509:433-1422(+)